MSAPADSGEKVPLTLGEVDAAIRLAEYVRKQERRQTWRRRGRKVAIALTVPVAGPMAGEWWENQERKGWR